MRKNVVIMILILVLIIAMTGCGQLLDNKSDLDQDNHTNEDPKEPGENSDTNDQEQGKESNDTDDKGQAEDDQGQNGLKMKTDSGRYIGRADSNFIEIKISGVPEENAARQFMLSEELKEKFEEIGLQTEDNIQFNYYENENKQRIIVQIKKI